MKKFLPVFLLMFFAIGASAQQLDLRRNLFKLNLSSLIFRNASVQYEHVLTPVTSFAIGTSYMPKTGLPFASSLKEQWGDNPDAMRAIETTQLSSFTITPEYRFYVSGKAPSGFYIAPFVRYQTMELEQVYQFTASSGKVHNPLISGNINNIGGGVLLGAQWLLGKTVSLDWWIAGPSVGSTNGLLTGTDDMSDLSASDRSDLKSDIESTQIPLTNVEATIGSNQIDVKLTGGYVGLRALGLTLGLRF